MNKAKDATGKKLPKLSYQQIDRIAYSLSMQLIQDYEAAKLVMLLFSQVAEYPYDNSHVETIANLVNMYLFALSTSESDDALRRLMFDYQAQIVKALEKGGAR